MNRKILILFATLLLTAAGASAQSRRAPISPYQYGHRWYFSLQAGPMVSFGENSESFGAAGHGWDVFTAHAALAIGYNFNDAWDMRVSGSYSYNPGACIAYDGHYPFHFHAAHLFADAVLSYNALAELNIPFNPKTYVGLGGAYTFGFTDPEHPFQMPQGPNIVPGFRVGGIAERDYPGGFGWFIDLGAEVFTDWYNGLEPVSFPLDVEIKVSFGIIYHFPLNK